LILTHIYWNLEAGTKNQKHNTQQKMPTTQHSPQGHGHAHSLAQGHALDRSEAKDSTENGGEAGNMPNLSTLSLDELKQLDRDPEFFDDFIEEMSVVQHLNEELDSMMNQVENISSGWVQGGGLDRDALKPVHPYNLGENESKGSHLVELKRRLSDDYTALKTLGEKCDQLNKKYLKKSEEYAPQHIRVGIEGLLKGDKG